ncbi:hypothetical protein [Prosthecobacter sp.]|uniref:hypothetical protein n=1 Tax=Prosthecobacter sp. TaxID=1965333 RepID=UPI003784103C
MRTAGWLVSAVLMVALVVVVCRPGPSPERQVGVVRDEEMFKIYVLGNLNRTSVTLMLNERGLAGGWMSTDESLGLAFEMSCLARPGDVLKVSVNEDLGEPMRGEVVLAKDTPRHVLVAVQKDRIEFTMEEKAPTFY